MRQSSRVAAVFACQLDACQTYFFKWIFPKGFKIVIYLFFLPALFDALEFFTLTIAFNYSYPLLITNAVVEEE